MPTTATPPTKAEHFDPPANWGQLCFYRKDGESIVIADKAGNVVAEITNISSANVRVMVEAPADVQVWRREIWDRELAKGAAA